MNPSPRLRWLLSAGVALLGLIGLVAVVVAIQLTAADRGRADREESRYRQAAKAGAEDLAAAMAALDRCPRTPFSGRLSTDCAGDLAAMDLEASSFQQHLRDNPAPACMEDEDRELRTALSYYREYAKLAQAGLGAESAETISSRADAAMALDTANEHMRLAGDLLARARC